MSPLATLLALTALTVLACPLLAQSPTYYSVNTIAGNGLPVDPGNNVLGDDYAGLAIDAAGHIFVALGNNRTVQQIDPSTGTFTKIANVSSLSSGIAVDRSGNLYVADTGNNRILRISGGVTSTIAGGGVVLGDNGPATSARLSQPLDVAVDSAGNIYIADSLQGRVRKVSNGIITTVAGNGSVGFSGDNGPATSAGLWEPLAVAVDSGGNLFINDYENGRIRKVSTDGIITTVAGDGTQGFKGDNGPAIDAEFSTPLKIAVDSSGSLYIADYGNNRVRKISNGIITTVAGTGTPASGCDNGVSATAAGLIQPSAVVFDSAGNLYIVDSGNSCLRKVSNGVISTVAGYGVPLGDNGPPLNAELSSPSGVTVNASGSIFVSDDVARRIRKIANGLITNFAGNGSPEENVQDFPLGGSGDNGPAVNAKFYRPEAVASDSGGNIYVADWANGTVRRISNGTITTVVGNGTPGYSGDNGVATSAQLQNPTSIAVDTAGSIFIADAGNNRIRKVANGTIITVAGSGAIGYSGDNGPATNAQLSLADGTPGIAVDANGNLYITDWGNNAIRKVTNGIITTVAVANRPASIAVDSTGNVFVTTDYESRIQKISGESLMPIAGTGAGGFSGDGGPAINAQVYANALAVDSAGKIYFADIGTAPGADPHSSKRIRVLVPAACSYTVTPPSVQFPSGGGNLVISIQAISGCAWALSGLPSWITTPGSASGTGNGSVTLVTPFNSGSARSVVISLSGISITISQAGIAAPTVSSVGPNVASAGGVGFTLTVNGTGFVNGSTVQWNGSALVTTFVSTMQLTALVPANLIATAGTATILVVNPGGAISNSLQFTVNVLSISALSPIAATAGGTTFTLTVNGSGFVPTSQVQWNGAALSTNYVNATQLTTSVPANLIAAAGTANVTVANPGGSISNGLSFPISSATLTITTSSLPGGTVGTAYSQNLSASGGTAPYNNWLVGAGSLPPGLTLDASAGTISGTPNSATGSPYSFSVLVKDSAGAISAPKSLSITVNQTSGLTIITATPLPGGMVGVPYTQGFAATGGLTPYRNWIVTAGTLPPGTSLTSIGGLLTALLSGTPTASGTFLFTVQVTDSVSATATKQFSITINPTNTITISAGGIVNSASYAGGGVAPGELVAIFGTGMGPNTLVNLQLDSAGNVATTLAGVQVSFDGRAAPLVYVSSTQLSVIVPYEISGKSSTQVQVSWQGQKSNTVMVPVVNAAPGIYTLDASGSGPGAILNLDGTINSPTNPAKIGSYVSIFATGEGQTNPAGIDGTLDGFPAPTPAQAVTATIGGVSANVQYAGGAAGLVAGVLQVNLQVPQGVTSGNNVPVLINIGGATTQVGVKVAIQGSGGPTP